MDFFPPITIKFFKILLLPVRKDLGTFFKNSCYLFCLLLVDADEIKRLGKRFKKLDLDNSGSLSVEEFMSLPELQQNPLVQRVIDIFDTDGNGEVDFKGKKVVIFYNHKLDNLFVFLQLYVKKKKKKCLYSLWPYNNRLC